MRFEIIKNLTILVYQETLYVLYVLIIWKVVILIHLYTVLLDGFSVYFRDHRKDNYILKWNT